jgi:hypothetical protein
MAKTGRAVAKLLEKSKRNAIAAHHGTLRAVVTRTKSSFHEKRIAFEAHRRLIQDHAINLGPRVTYVKKSGDDVATTFRGDGLPDEVTRVVKTTKQRAEEDKRNKLSSEWKRGFRPSVNTWQPHDVVKAALKS